MKKVISINFQGRVIPIEETAYELLKQYIESLRRYFAGEEGHEEIINDIESRIAELFSERLRNGLTCITDEDVNKVIADMGRPEDFEAQEGEASPSGQQQVNAPPVTGNAPRRSFYRNEDDKIIAGVCSGLANYLNIDPVIMRIVFVLLFGILFWVYVLLWIIVPSRSIQSNITKRLFRDPDRRVIGGVCGGIAAYFNIEVWIPRLIFALPFILAAVSGGAHLFWWNGSGFTPRVISGSFGGTLFFTYIILWIAVPYAHTSSQRLEMRGEKVDLNSIRDTVKKDRARSFTEEAGYVAVRSARGIIYIIGLLLKIIMIFILAVVAVALFAVFVTLLFGGIAFEPLKAFILDGILEHVLAWLTIVLVFVLPLVALITWGVRRILNIRSKKHYVALGFMALWILGLISGIVLFILMAQDFRNSSSLEEEQITIVQPRRETLYVDIEKSNWKNHNSLIFKAGAEENPWPFNVTYDSALISTVRVSMVKSDDTAFHVYRIRASRGSNKDEASRTAEKIVFDIQQRDSVLVLPEGFYIGREDKFRNQRVWVVIEVPVGKKIAFSDHLSVYNWLYFGPGRHNRFMINGNDWNSDAYIHRASPGKEYIMLPDGKPHEVDNSSTTFTFAAQTAKFTT